MALPAKALKVGQEDYWLDQIARDREEYFSGHGESPGRYVGSAYVASGLGGIAYRAGPSVGALETHSVSFAFGAALGIVAIETATYSVVPAFGGGVTIVRLTARIGDEDETESETFGTVDFGVGFIFNRRVSVTPRIAIPVGGDSNDPVFGFSVAVNFGR